MSEARIAYFSMEIGLRSGHADVQRRPRRAGGRHAPRRGRLGVPMVAVTLLHRKGYFRQRLDGSGWQTEEPVEWIVEDFLRELPQRAAVTIEGRTVLVRAWRYASAA